MAKKILLAVGAVLVLFLVVVAMQPAEFSLKRSGTMNAPAAVAYALVADFKAWEQWSPWDKLDPKQERVYSEPSMGLGANYHWKGDKVGEGNMKITEAKPGEHLSIALDFIKPFPASNPTTFDFAESNGVTTVTWTMSGKYDFMGKAFSLFMNMDKSVGGDFERGLAAMKTAAEAQAAELKKKAADEAAAAEAAKAAADAAAAVDAGTP